MQVAEVKTSSSASPNIQAKRQPFFNKEGQGGFFSKSNEATEAFFSPTTIQPKPASPAGRLTIGQPNDKYEVEADAMADKVVQRLNSSFEGGKGDVSIANNSVGVQAKCSHGQEEEKLQKKEKDQLLQNKLEIQLKPIFESNAEAPEANLQTKPLTAPSIQAKCTNCEQEEKLQLKEESDELSELQSDVQSKSMDGGSEAPSNLQSRLNSSSGGGSSLPNEIQTSMGSAFGADFSGVKVHTGSEAVQMSNDIGAQAFTHGNDIYFNQGKYDTNSNSGKHLLAHELTHTMQQKGASGVSQKKIQRWPDWADSAASWVSDTASSAASSVADGAEWVGGQVADGAAWVGGQVADGAEWVGDQLSEAADWLIERINGAIDSGTDFLDKKWEVIQAFGTSSFDDIKKGFSGLASFITSPMSTIVSAMSDMNADILVAAYNVLKAGGSTLLAGINSIVDGVLAAGDAIWGTVTGFIDGIFDTIEGLFNNTAFNLLPDFITSGLRSALSGFRSLWNRISSFWTNLWDRLTSFAREIIDAVQSFVENAINFGIEQVISMVRKLKEIYDFVMATLMDPEGTVAPLVEAIAGKISAEGPVKSQELGNQLSHDNFSGDSSHTQDNGTIQRVMIDGEERTTASLSEVIEGIIYYLGEAWNGLTFSKILEMLWTTITDLIWPWSSIGEQFSNLWNDDWNLMSQSLYRPRNLLVDPIGCLHDIWSNYMILFDFPIALIRTLNNVIGLLMGWITIIMVLLGAAIGAAGGAAFFGVAIPAGIGAGAAAGLAVMEPLGLILAASIIGTETQAATIIMGRLFTANQACKKRQVDIMTSVASVITASVTAIVAIVMMALARLIALIAEFLKGAPRSVPAPAPGVPAPAPGLPAPAPAPGIPAPAPAPAPRVPVHAPTPGVGVPVHAAPGPAQVPGQLPQPAAPSGGNVIPFPNQPTPVPQPAAPSGGNVVPFPNQPVPVSPLPPGQIAAKFEEGESIISITENFNKENKSTVIKNKHKEKKESNGDIEKMPLSSVLNSVDGTVQAARIDQINPDVCKDDDDDDDALYKWEPKINYKNNPTRPGKFNYGGATRPGVDYSLQAHHSWPKVLGGDPNQRLVTIIETIHQAEIHRGFSPVGSPIIAVIGSIYNFITNYINSSATFGPGGNNVLQGRPLNHTGSSGSSNQLLINAMKTGTSTAARLKGTVRQGMSNYYKAFEAASDPIMPSNQYKDGLDDSYSYI